MYQKVHVGNLIRLEVWNEPDKPDEIYGLVLKVANVSPTSGQNLPRYWVLSPEGVGYYDWTEIQEILCD